MKEKPTSAEAEVYRCIHCAGMANILIREHTKKEHGQKLNFALSVDCLIYTQESSTTNKTNY
jgi:hypothetical protein